MLIKEVVEIKEELILTEDMLSKIKALGLAGLLSLGLTLGASGVQAKQYNAQELLSMGFSNTQAEFISKQPENLQQMLIKAKTSKEAPSVKFDADNVKSVMGKMVQDDPLIKNYSVKGDTLILQMDNDRMEQGYKNYLQIQKKLNKPNEFKNAHEYSGFNDKYKQSLIQKTGVKNIQFN
jgi:hypothetical protein